MTEEFFLNYTLNNTNSSLTNSTKNSTIPTVYSLGPGLVVASSISIVIGTFFSIISIYRYLRKPNLRTYFTYIFHYMLIYCLIASFINIPIFLTGFYLHLFEYSYRFCQYYNVNALSVNIGMVTCLAYTSLERHSLIFRQNGLLSWRRQIIPIICLIFYSYSVSMLIVFIPQCEYIPCIPCHAIHLQYMLIWLTISFMIPELIMFISTIILVIRLYRQGINLKSSKDRSIFYRIFLQMILYIIWSCLYYCPPTFYNLAAIIKSEQFSPSMKSVMMIINTITVQSYSILTFILMTNYRRKITNKITKQLSNESAIKTNRLSITIEPPIVQ
ncbi:unnamed protein product [Rotaria sp. Silwood2]|nr:unnamed protein product [Rotaria sp. Silwood2]CAF3115271.1 unnamed protein product [Rotaria sp. Silwood2]CAF4203494.1 unnamed protein product [Rotaria sp. Silwood2]CAF4216384.1 unnamed protein product [Rotaria sp. Silwood2]